MGGYLYRLAQHGLHDLHSLLGSLRLLACRPFRLVARALLGQFPLCLGGDTLCLGHLQGRLCLVALLGRYHAFVVEPVQTAIGLLGHLLGRHGLLVDLVGTLHGLATGGRGGEVAQGRRGIGRGLRHLFLGVNLGYLEDGECVALLDMVALLHFQIDDAARQLAGHAVFADLYRSLDDLGVFFEKKVAHEAHDDDDGREAQDGEQDVVML